MRFIKNECIQCHEEWEVDTNWAKLDEVDQTNIKNHGQLFGICEDCTLDQEFESVLV